MSLFEFDILKFSYELVDVRVIIHYSTELFCNWRKVFSASYYFQSWFKSELILFWHNFSNGFSYTECVFSYDERFDPYIQFRFQLNKLFCTFIVLLILFIFQLFEFRINQLDTYNEYFTVLIYSFCFTESYFFFKLWLWRST